ncbi:response regulator [Paenibacillus sp. FSL R7-0273]|uniref:response regulator n=1 Tax=Paenibacillus sp. FSL R7-0273 TaxID=1536772 RepID=UPI0004F5F84A|nr:response regulator [Paenibacillus sp. FSL R7-0273]AIQ46859.1 response regulator [Paenibacillus sp. FSL R7-0273]OMF97373.1 two-component system response regulator [Paenibacillus sp. FSL R7-0273]
MGGQQEQYKVLLVDDEPIILRSLKVAIPWEELGLTIAGEARNGEAALRLIEEISPQIVISDIRMPVIDGIALMKTLLPQNPKLLFIFISGYGEFEYARDALRLGAFDYLLKPIDHDELSEMLTRARAKLDRQKENEQLMHSVQMLSTLARERMFAEFTLGNPRPLQHLKWLENSELEREYFMAVVRLDDYASLTSKWSAEEKHLWLFAIRNILEEWSLENGALSIFPFYNGEWVLLFPGSLGTVRKELGERLVADIKRYSKLHCSVGVSRSTRGIDQLSTVYPLAAKALYRRFYSGEAGVFIEEETPEAAEQEVQYPKELELSLIESIRTLNLERMLLLFDEMSCFIEAQALPKELAQRVIIELVVVLYRQFEQMGLQAEWSLEGLLGKLQGLGTLTSVTNVLKQDFRDWMLEGSRQAVRDDGRSVVDKARRYIEANYHKDLSIEEVAEVADLSISHFCTLFKQVSGYTFLEFVTHCRMEKAKDILQNSSVKVYQVAPLVGYQDPKYFTQVFKKATGKTPTEYREEVVRLAGEG